MADKAIIAVDDLTGAVAEWRALDKDALLEVGDRLNDVHQRLQLVIGAWLFVYEDALGYGDIKRLAERFSRKASTLTKWKQVYKKTRNVDSNPLLSFGAMQQIARIPAEHQADWIEFAESNPVAKIREAVSAAKDDWQPPADEIVVLEPEPVLPDTISATKESESEIESVETPTLLNRVLFGYRVTIERVRG